MKRVMRVLLASAFFVVCLVSFAHTTILPTGTVTLLSINPLDSIRTNMDRMPEPVGGEAALAKYVKYPKKAKKEGIQGKVIILTTIDEQGNVTAASVMHGIGHGCDEAALNAIRKTKFNPAVVDGKRVKTQVTIPIQFKLDDEHDRALSNKNNSTVGQLKKTGEVFENAEEMPTPVGGIEGLLKNFKYPQAAMDKKIQGRVFIQFVVTSNGAVENVVVMKSLDPICDDAAVNYVKTTKWNPGKVKGVPVNVQIVLPINFALN